MHPDRDAASADGGRGINYSAMKTGLGVIAAPFAGQPVYMGRFHFTAVAVDVRVAEVVCQD